MQQLNEIKSELDIFNKYESNVRVYSRSFPSVFTRAQGHKLWDTNHHEYIDFFSGAGALNYGHNHPKMKKALIDYILADGITHSLDMHTEMKSKFISEFVSKILRPRNLNYKLQFVGPTGSNSVEAALKLARTVTGRKTIISFTDGFHGMTLGALAVTANIKKRQAAHVDLNQYVLRAPFDQYTANYNSLEHLENMIKCSANSGNVPAACIIETIQAEGGLNVPRTSWLINLQALLRNYNILLIIDDIQAGCGRTGKFFSFEQAQLQPDMVCLSKSLSGYGLPMSLLLLKPSLDVQSPGDHTSTFRGNNLAFITSRIALNFWHDSEFLALLNKNIGCLNKWLVELEGGIGNCFIKGHGMMRGLNFVDSAFAMRIKALLYRKNILIETCGVNNSVLKIMPPLNIPTDDLSLSLNQIKNIILENQ